MTAWINLQIHDWFFHNVTDDNPWTLQARSAAYIQRGHFQLVAGRCSIRDWRDSRGCRLPVRCLGAPCRAC